MSEIPNGEVWDITEEDDIQVREVYARYGLVMYKAQLLECSMVNLLAAFFLFPEVKKYENIESWSVALDGFYDGKFKKTFGNLMRDLNSISGIPGNVLELLLEAKKNRDYFAHNFFRDNDLNFMNFHGRRKMIIECDLTINRLSQVDAVIDSLVKNQCKKFGITDELIGRELNKILGNAE